MDAVTLALLKALYGGSGGSGLPSTEAASAGDVLTLDNSKDPQWAAPSGGGGALKIGVTVTQSGDETTYTLDKTWKQIVDAVNGGIIPYICIDLIDGSTGVHVLIEYSVVETDYRVVFNAVYSTTSETGYPSFTEGGK